MPVPIASSDAVTRIAEMARPPKAKRRRQRWWKPEDELICTRPLAEAAQLIGRTVSAVKARRNVLKEKGGPIVDLRTTAARAKVGRSIWTPQVDRLVKRKRPAVVAKHLGIAKTSVHRRRRALGLKPFCQSRFTRRAK